MSVFPKKTSGTLTEPLSSKRDFGMIWGEMSPSCLGDRRKMSTLTTASAFFAYVITRAVHTLGLVIIKRSHFPLFSCNNTSHLKCQQFSRVLHFIDRVPTAQSITKRLVTPAYLVLTASSLLDSKDLKHFQSLTCQVDSPVYVCTVSVICFT